MSLLEPLKLPVYTPERFNYEAATDPTPLGAYLGAKIQTGFDQSIAGLGIRQATGVGEGSGPLPGDGTSREELAGMGYNVDQRRVTEDEWRKLKLDRPGLKFSGGGTVEYERARTRDYDERRYRESLIDRYKGNAATYALGFGAQMLGGLPSPENFVPFVGPGVRAAMVARLGVIGGHIAAGAADAAIGNLAADALTFPDLNRRGEDLGVEDLALDLALGAVTGGLFGAGGGWLARRQQMRDVANAVRIDGLQRQADAVELALGAVTRDEAVDVGPVLADALPAIRERLEPMRQQLLSGTAALPGNSGFELSGMPGRRPLLDPGVREELRATDEVIPYAEQTVAPGAGMSFLSTLRQAGGIRPTSEIDVDWKELAKRFPGLVNKDGLRVDEAVNRATSDGFLPELDGVSHADRSDEIGDLLDQMLAGNTRPDLIDEPDIRAARELQAEWASIDQHLIERAKEEFDTPLSGVELAFARQLVHEHGFDDADALVQAMTYAALRNDEGGFHGGIAEDAFDIPFDDVPGRAGEGDGGWQPSARAPADRAAGALPDRPEALSGPAAVRQFVADAVAKERAPDPPATLAEAEARLGKPQTAQTLAEDLGVGDPKALAQRLVAADDAKAKAAEAAQKAPPDPQKEAALAQKALLSDISEMQDVDALRRVGALTEADERALTEADDLMKRADGWADAYSILAGCSIRHGS